MIALHIQADADGDTNAGLKRHKAAGFQETLHLPSGVAAITAERPDLASTKGVPVIEGDRMHSRQP